MPSCLPVLLLSDDHLPDCRQDVAVHRHSCRSAASGRRSFLGEGLRISAFGLLWIQVNEPELFPL